MTQQTTTTDDFPPLGGHDSLCAHAAGMSRRCTCDPVCACRESGQDGDGWVRYQARDGEFVTLRCRNHTAQEN